MNSKSNVVSQKDTNKTVTHVSAALNDSDYPVVYGSYDFEIESLDSVKLGSVKKEASVNHEITPSLYPKNRKAMVKKFVKYLLGKPSMSKT